MPNPDYKRPMRFIRRNYANVAATVALVVALRVDTSSIEHGLVVQDRRVARHVQDR